jgi:hypothetical protein
MADEKMDNGGDPKGHQAGVGQVADQEGEIRAEDLENEDGGEEGSN